MHMMHNPPGDNLVSTGCETSDSRSSLGERPGNCRFESQVSIHRVQLRYSTACLFRLVTGETRPVHSPVVHLEKQIHNALFEVVYQSTPRRSKSLRRRHAWYVEHGDLNAQVCHLSCPLGHRSDQNRVGQGGYKQNSGSISSRFVQCEEGFVSVKLSFKSRRPFGFTSNSLQPGMIV